MSQNAPETACADPGAPVYPEVVERFTLVVYFLINSSCYLVIIASPNVLAWEVRSSEGAWQSGILV